MNELKPCPFCGGKAELKQYRGDGMSIRCTRCVVKKQQRTKYQTLEWLEDKLITWWNARAPDKELEACCKLLIENGISTGHGDSFTDLIEECIDNVEGLREQKAAQNKRLMASSWIPMSTAPKGGGAELVTDANWVEPPRIFLLFNNAVSVGYWDWYYAEGGRGYNGGLAWIEPISGERLDLNYDEPVGWQPIAEIPA